MCKLDEKVRSAVKKLKDHNLIPKHGEVAVDAAYWSEVLDPKHSPGHGRKGNVAYLSDAKRKPHVATFDGDKLKIKRTSVFKIGINHSTQGSVIFVIDRSRNFYVGIKAIGQFHHSSFLSGSQALAAGSMRLAEGFKILEVNNHSGHYKPSLEQLRLTAVIMHLQGADLNKIPFKYSPPQGKHVEFGNGLALLRHPHD